MKKQLIITILGSLISLPLCGMNANPLSAHLTAQHELVTQGLLRVNGLQGEARTQAMRELLDQYNQGYEQIGQLWQAQEREILADVQQLEAMAVPMGLIHDEAKIVRTILYCGLIGIFAASIYVWYKEYKAKKDPLRKK